MSKPLWNVDAGSLSDCLVPVLCVWREASGEGPDGMYAVACVLRNRSLKNDCTVDKVCLVPYQFSSMTAKGDPGMTRFPQPGDPSFLAAYNAWRMAERAALPDPTHGATDYYSVSIEEPWWAPKYIFTAQIGKHKFYKRT